MASFSSQERCDNVVIVPGAVQEAMVRGGGGGMGSREIGLEPPALVSRTRAPSSHKRD